MSRLSFDLCTWSRWHGDDDDDTKITKEEELSVKTKYLNILIFIFNRLKLNLVYRGYFFMEYLAQMILFPLSVYITPFFTTVLLHRSF